MAERVCISCGLPEGTVVGNTSITFRSGLAQKCLQCDADYDEERKTYGTLYHRARRRAASRLKERHEAEWERIFAEERTRAEDEEEKKRRKK